MSETSYVRSIQVHNNYVDRDFEIDLSPPDGQPFLHLVLTGRNGTGKSTTLGAIRNHIHKAIDGRTQGGAGATVTWSDGWRPSRGGRKGLNRCAVFGANRKVNITKPQGPKSEDRLSGSVELEQWLVNLATKQVFAGREGDAEAEAEYLFRLTSAEEAIRGLLGVPALSLHFDYKEMAYTLNIDGLTVSFQHLPDGHNSALDLWASLSAREQVDRPPQVVIIDEVETHLHLSLQESILPFLTQAFPKCQFIVATHSPAVIASLDNAVVYDLTTHTSAMGHEFKGVTYGSIMTEHFGISTDYDLDTSRRLERMTTLAQLQSRTKNEQVELERLASELSQLSVFVAMLVHERMQSVVDAS